MFGTVRFLLAYMVVLAHLTGAEFLAHFGYYAVRAFFVLSGYVITASLNETYRFRAAPFWLNRALKLLPPYYLICALTLVAVAAFPIEAGSFLKFWSVAPTSADLLLNFLVVPLQFPEPHFRMVPPAWSIAVEIVMYFVLWSFAARGRWYAAFALLIGVGYHVACLFDGLSWSFRYFLAPSALLSFPIGALIYFGLRRTEPTTLGRLVPVSFAAWAANLVVAAWTPGDFYDFGLGYYLNVTFFALIAAGVAKAEWKPWAQRVDRWLGDLAYPMFLCHWLVGFLFAQAFMPGVSRGIGFTLAATPSIVLASYGLALAIRAFVEPLRSAVRTPAQSGPRVQPSASVGTLVRLVRGSE